MSFIRLLGQNLVLFFNKSFIWRKRDLVSPLSGNKACAVNFEGILSKTIFNFNSPYLDCI